MEVAIMQPYFFPYIGYFQLMNAVDEFVIYDNIEFSKKGWIHRNRILVNGEDSYISIPLKRDSDYLDIRDRYLADVWINEKQKMLNKIKGSYKKSPNFNFAYPVIEKAISYEENNLFKFLLNSLNVIKEYLEIQTSFVTSSTLSIDHNLTGDKKVMAICKARKTNTYLNPIGGTQLYIKEDFKDVGIDLNFLKTGDIKYQQFNNAFVPSLSIIDVMMFNTKEVIREYLYSSYTLI